MTPFNVMAKNEFLYQSKPSFYIQEYQLPKANAVPTNVSHEICLKRCILNLITIPNLRGAFIFRFQKNHTRWTIYEPSNAPLTVNEVRGALVLAMREQKQVTASALMKIKPSDKFYIKKTKPIIKDIENITETEYFFVVLLFKELLFMAGNYYDESILCHALVQFQKRKIINYPKVETQQDLLERRKVQPKLLQPISIGGLLHEIWV